MSSRSQLAPLSRILILLSVGACFFFTHNTNAQRRAARRVPTVSKPAKAIVPRARKVTHPSSLTLRDGTLIGQPWTGDEPIAETTAAIMEREQSHAASLQNEPQQIRPPKPERETPERDKLPQNPNALPGAQWPEIGEGVTGRKGDGATNESAAPQPVTFSFTAATAADSGYYPPDSMGAVGPAQFLLAINGRIRAFDKNSGVIGALNADLDVFFESVRETALTTDPRVRFDRLSNRWFVACINYLRAGQLVLNNKVLLAVSDGPTITTTTVWRFYSFQHNTVAPAGTSGLFADYPTFAVDHNALYVGVNLFYADDSFGGCDLFVIRKSSVVNGGTLVATAFRGLSTGPNSSGMFTPQGADSVETNNTGYVIGTDNAALGKLIVRRVSDPGGTPVLSPNLNLNVLATAPPVRVPHLGNTQGTDGNLDAIGDRLFAAHIRNGRLWTAHNIGTDHRGTSLGSRTRTAARWYEIGDLDNDPPRLIQAGTVFADSTNNTTDTRHYFIPTLMTSGQGHMALGASSAGANEYINAATAGRLATDALGTTRAPLLFTAASQPYNPARDTGDAAIGRRWGDYSFTSLDPCDDMTMWTVQQFVDGLNSYGVKVAKLAAPPPALPASANPPSVPVGQSNVEITITGLANDGAGFYDPGANFACRLNAQVSGGVTVQRITYVNATTLRLTLSTVGATTGAQNVAVTNPDGQSVTGNGIFTVGECSYNVTPLTHNVTASGASLALNVTSGSGCGWTAISQSPFITVTSGATSSANGSVGFTVAPNINAVSRTGALLIAGQTVSVTQAAGAGCTYELTPAAQNFLSYGGVGTVTVAAANDCAWAATASDGWVNIIPGFTGRGNGTISFTIAANTTPQQRVATITFGNRNFVITQEAAPREIAIDDGSFERDSGSTVAGTIYRVNRLTPQTSTPYPVTLTSVAIYFSGRGGARVGADFTLIAGHNADGDNVIDGTVFQQINLKIAAVNEFSVYALPAPLTINAGDFVVGFRMVTTPDVIPLGFDNNNPARRRSYRSDDGVAFTLSEGAGGTAVNYGIRARLTGGTQELIGLEADIAPRPTGNDALTVTDWTLMGRFVAGLLTPALGNEFQRADCAPRETGGDGRLSAADFTQAGRYAAGLDEPMRAAGPLAPLFAYTVTNELAAFGSPALKTAQGEALGKASPSMTSPERASDNHQDYALSGLETNAPLYPGLHLGLLSNRPFRADEKQQTLTMTYLSTGHENALSGTLRFAPDEARLLRVTSALPNAQLILNEQALAQGRLGFVIALPSGTTLPAGTQDLFTLHFAPRTPLRLRFWTDDTVIVREAADARARPLALGNELRLGVR